MKRFVPRFFAYIALTGGISLKNTKSVASDLQKLSFQVLLDLPNENIILFRPSAIGVCLLPFFMSSFSGMFNLAIGSQHRPLNI